MVQSFAHSTEPISRTEPPPKSAAWTRARDYGVALALTALALGANWAIASTVQPGVTYLFFTTAILLAGITGGFGPGILATALILAYTLPFGNLGNLSQSGARNGVGLGHYRRRHVHRR